MENIEIKPKAIAMYLPQFHDVKENNTWWGEGFTDWRAMECAKPLFEGHKQPKCPLNNYKYDLTEKSVMVWQADLMHKYGIFGMAIYHYWFKNGKKILEKPAENLLSWKEINMPFCFYWANESWVRSWSKIENQNVWAGSFEKKAPEDSDTGILLEQDYGNTNDWVKHFEYLIDFFEDSRYIKIDNKPVFIIYKPAEITYLEEMLSIWNKLAIERGFSGIYLIGAGGNGDFQTCLSAELFHEPALTIKTKFNERFANENQSKVARYLSYDDVWRESLENNNQNKVTTYFGGFAGYDDTPRRGNAGTVVFNSTPEKFKIYLTELFAKNAAAGNELVFINAWNEWGEGMYLEPDEEYKYGYLEAFLYAQEHFKEEMYKYEEKHIFDKETDKNIRLQAEKRRYIDEKNLLDKWLYIVRNGKTIFDYFRDRGISHFAVYGYGVFGKQLLDELHFHDDMVCDFLIDKNARGINIDIDVYSPEDEIPSTEIIIVSTIHIFEEVKNLLQNRTNSKVISIKEIINYF